MALKMQVERLLHSNMEIDTEIYGVPEDKVRLFAKTYKSEVEHIPKMKNFFTIIKHEKVSVTLNTMKKTWE